MCSTKMYFFIIILHHYAKRFFNLNTQKSVKGQKFAKKLTKGKKKAVEIKFLLKTAKTSKMIKGLSVRVSKKDKLLVYTSNK